MHYETDFAYWYSMRRARYTRLTTGSKITHTSCPFLQQKTYNERLFVTSHCAPPRHCFQHALDTKGELEMFSPGNKDVDPM